MPVPLAPLDEQQEIVRRVDAPFKAADAIENRLEAATNRADKLNRALLAKAFRGELVATEAELARREGREYEPAAALLERIRAERASGQTGGKITHAQRKLRRTGRRSPIDRPDASLVS